VRIGVDGTGSESCPLVGFEQAMLNHQVLVDSKGL
jgi:hypothetical protein